MIRHDARLVCKAPDRRRPSHSNDESDSDVADDRRFSATSSSGASDNFAPAGPRRFGRSISGAAEKEDDRSVGIKKKRSLPVTWKSLNRIAAFSQRFYPSGNNNNKEKHERLRVSNSLPVKATRVASCVYDAADVKAMSDERRRARPAKGTDLTGADALTARRPHLFDPMLLRSCSTDEMLRARELREADFMRVSDATERYDANSADEGAKDYGEDRDAWTRQKLLSLRLGPESTEDGVIASSGGGKKTSAEIVRRATFSLQQRNCAADGMCDTRRAMRTAKSLHLGKPPHDNSPTRTPQLGRKLNGFIGGDNFSNGDVVKKGSKKNKFRKSLSKQVGKTSPGWSSQFPPTDDAAERTWDTEGNCTWHNMSGRKVELESTELHSLSELECGTLQKVALQRFNLIDLGVPVVVPKDDSKILKNKNSIKKKYAMHLMAKKNKEKAFDHVFGISLVDVVENDQLLRLQKSATFAATLSFAASPDSPDAESQPMFGASTASMTSSSDGSLCSGITGDADSTERRDSVETVGVASPERSPDVIGDDVIGQLQRRRSRCELTCPVAQQARGSPPVTRRSYTVTAARPLKRRGAIGADSLNEIDASQSQLLEALSLSVSGNSDSQRNDKKASLLPPTMEQVPYVVQKCCDHITKYGLDVMGIFRVAGSKKRVKQLREEFDRGVDVTIDEDYNPHDVAALLKEFFRDLPEALLTRELYPAFLQTAKLPPETRVSALRYLVWLLPLPNRDSLRTLLRFLAHVAAHSEPGVDDVTGQKYDGNKMSIQNLATIFGPNILHRYKKTTGTGNDVQFQGGAAVERISDSSSVIRVVEDMISHHQQLFQIPKEEHDEMLRKLKDTDPEAVDFLLRRKAAHYMREKALSKQHSNRHRSSSQSSCISDASLEAGADDGRRRKNSGSLRSSYELVTGHVIGHVHCSPPRIRSRITEAMNRRRMVESCDATLDSASSEEHVDKISFADEVFQNVFCDAKRPAPPQKAADDDEGSDEVVTANNEEGDNFSPPLPPAAHIERRATVDVTKRRRGFCVLIDDSQKSGSNFDFSPHRHVVDSSAPPPPVFVDVVGHRHEMSLRSSCHDTGKELIYSSNNAYSIFNNSNNNNNNNSDACADSDVKTEYRKRSRARARLSAPTTTAQEVGAASEDAIGAGGVEPETRVRRRRRRVPFGPQQQQRHAESPKRPLGAAELVHEDAIAERPMSAPCGTVTLRGSDGKREQRRNFRREIATGYRPLGGARNKGLAVLSAPSGQHLPETLV